MRWLVDVVSTDVTSHHCRVSPTPTSATTENLLQTFVCGSFLALLLEQHCRSKHGIGIKRQVRRRRECAECRERFTTFESPELVMPRLIKRDDTREPFDENKLRNGIVRALEKRPVSSETIEEIISHIIHRLQTMGEQEIAARELGEMVMQELQEVDEVAYVRFASVYRSFQDVTEFQDEIRRLQEMTGDSSRRNQMSLLPDDKKS